MSQNIEIEFKNLLTREEYIKLKSFFNLENRQFSMQENHYFDTASFSLKNKHSALRIREKNSQYGMTLKQPAGQGLLESNQIISSSEATAGLQTGKLPDGLIRTLIEEMGLDFFQLEYFGSLKTERAEFEYREGLLVLDHSYYLNTEDFEVEYEVENYEVGQTIFTNFLQEQNIPERRTKNKIVRFYERKMQS